MPSGVSLFLRRTFVIGFLKKKKNRKGNRLTPLRKTKNNKERIVPVVAARTPGPYTVFLVLQTQPTGEPHTHTHQLPWGAFVERRLRYCATPLSLCWTRSRSKPASWMPARSAIHSAVAR
nr:hypothetical protein [Pandoravirus massiliensis]